MTTRLNGFADQGWGVYRTVPTGISAQDRQRGPSRNVERMLFRKMHFPPVFGTISTNNPPMDVFLKRKLLRENPMSMMGGKRRKRKARKPKLGQVEFMTVLGGMRKQRRSRRK